MKIHKFHFPINQSVINNFKTPPSRQKEREEKHYHLLSRRVFFYFFSCYKSLNFIFIAFCGAKDFINFYAFLLIFFSLAVCPNIRKPWALFSREMEVIAHISFTFLRACVDENIMSFSARCYKRIPFLMLEQLYLPQIGTSQSCQCEIYKHQFLFIELWNFLASFSASYGISSFRYIDPRVPESWTYLLTMRVCLLAT